MDKTQPQQHQQMLVERRRRSSQESVDSDASSEAAVGHDILASNESFMSYVVMQSHAHQIQQPMQNQHQAIAAQKTSGSVSTLSTVSSSSSTPPPTSASIDGSHASMSILSPNSEAKQHQSNNINNLAEFLRATTPPLSPATTADNNNNNNNSIAIIDDAVGKRQKQRRGFFGIGTRRSKSKDRAETDANLHRTAGTPAMGGGLSISGKQSPPHPAARSAAAQRGAATTHASASGTVTKAPVGSMMAGVKKIKAAAQSRTPPLQRSQARTNVTASKRSGPLPPPSGGTAGKADLTPSGGRNRQQSLSLSRGEPMSPTGSVSQVPGSVINSSSFTNIPSNKPMSTPRSNDIGRPTSPLGSNTIMTSSPLPLQTHVQSEAQTRNSSPSGDSVTIVNPGSASLQQRLRAFAGLAAASSSDPMSTLSFLSNLEQQRFLQQFVPADGGDSDGDDYDDHSFSDDDDEDDYYSNEDIEMDEALLNNTRYNAILDEDLLDSLMISNSPDALLPRVTHGRKVVFNGLVEQILTTRLLYEDDDGADYDEMRPEAPDPVVVEFITTGPLRGFGAGGGGGGSGGGGGEKEEEAEGVGSVVAVAHGVASVSEDAASNVAVSDLTGMMKDIAGPQQRMMADGLEGGVAATTTTTQTQTDPAPSAPLGPAVAVDAKPTVVDTTPAASTAKDPSENAASPTRPKTTTATTTPPPQRRKVRHVQLQTRGATMKDQTTQTETGDDAKGAGVVAVVAGPPQPTPPAEQQEAKASNTSTVALESTISDLQASLDSALRSQSTAESTITTLQASLDAALNNQTTSDSTIATLRASLDATASTLATTQSLLATEHAELVATRAENAALRDANDALRREMELARRSGEDERVRFERLSGLAVAKIRHMLVERKVLEVDVAGMRAHVAALERQHLVWLDSDGGFDDLEEFLDGDEQDDDALFA